jgi:pyruvate ferredoxin oxidoreductase alpha subunit
MSKIVALTGNEAAAEALRQIDPDVIAAYPITPQTELMHKYAEFVANGLVKTEMILVESEHSAMSATIGASAAGARAMTATSSQGLALMWEVVYVAASLRLPIVMPVINRALSGPINIHCDHSDTMGCRDSGWIQLFSEDSQEVYDNCAMALPVAEHPDVLTPVMVNFDGFIISHTMERLEILEDKQIKDFVGTYKPAHYLLNAEKPVSIGPLDLQDYYFEHRRAQEEGVEKSKNVILEVSKKYGALSGRNYGFFEEFMMNDAEEAIVCLGSTAGTIKSAIKKLRALGKKVGLVKVRMYRPFPYAELAAALGKVKAVAVLDRSYGYGNIGGPLFVETQSALHTAGASPKDILVGSYLYGLGGRDITEKHIAGVYYDLFDNVKQGKVKKVKNYVNLRGEDSPELIYKVDSSLVSKL